MDEVELKEGPHDHANWLLLKNSESDGLEVDHESTVSANYFHLPRVNEPIYCLVESLSHFESHFSRLGHLK